MTSEPAQFSFDLHERVNFDHAGAWPLRITLDGNTLVDTTLRVVTGAKQVRNRAPYRIGVHVATDGTVAQCVVVSPLAVRDLDFDLVRYRYRWTAGGKPIRTVTSTMLSDTARVPAGATPHCSVTPSDGRLNGPTAAG